MAREQSGTSQRPPGRSSTSGPFDDLVAEASRRFGIPAAWICAVMRIESGGDVRAVSVRKAMGLMQIMPGTWTELRARHGLGSDPYDPRDNILAGTAYLREMRDRYGSPGFLAAYNAGPARYEAHLKTGRPLPVETQRYVAALAPLIGETPNGGSFSIARAAFDRRTWTRAPLFANRAEMASSSPQQSSGIADRAAPDAQPQRPPVRRAFVDLSAIVPPSAGLFAARPTAEQRP